MQIQYIDKVRDKHSETDLKDSEHKPAVLNADLPEDFSLGNNELAGEVGEEPLDGEEPLL